MRSASVKSSCISDHYGHQWAQYDIGRAAWAPKNQIVGQMMMSPMFCPDQPALVSRTLATCVSRQLEGEQPGPKTVDHLDSSIPCSCIFVRSEDNYDIGFRTQFKTISPSAPTSTDPEQTIDTCSSTYLRLYFNMRADLIFVGEKKYDKGHYLSAEF
jgi:hypothetical protein